MGLFYPSMHREKPENVSTSPDRYSYSLRLEISQSALPRNVEESQENTCKLTEAVVNPETA